MPIGISQNPSWHTHNACFLQATKLKGIEFNIKETNKYSPLRSRGTREMLASFLWKKRKRPNNGGTVTKPAIYSELWHLFQLNCACGRSSSRWYVTFNVLRNIKNALLNNTGFFDCLRWILPQEVHVKKKCSFCRVCRSILDILQHNHISVPF